MMINEKQLNIPNIGTENTLINTFYKEQTLRFVNWHYEELMNAERIKRDVKTLNPAVCENLKRQAINNYMISQEGFIADMQDMAA